MAHLRMSEEHKQQLLNLIQTICPWLDYAPEESWLEDDVTSRATLKGSEPVGFRNVCECDLGPMPPEIVVFLKGDGVDCGTNLVGRLEHAIERWALRTKEIDWQIEGCGTCKWQLRVDVRLFLPKMKADPLIEAEEDLYSNDEWVN